MLCDLISIRQQTVQRFNLTILVIKPSGKIVIADSRKVNQKSGIEQPSKRQASFTFRSPKIVKWKVSFTCRGRSQIGLGSFVSLADGRRSSLANEVGVSRQSINSIERGRYVPSLLLALTFAKVFESSADQIFTLS
jgi:putative transcriptional regulator